METKRIILVSILFGLLFWVVDAVLGCYFFSTGTFLDLLLFDVPAHELYIRSVVLVCFLLFGALISGVVSNRGQVERALRESERRFRSIVEQSGDGIVLTDEDRKSVV